MIVKRFRVWLDVEMQIDERISDAAERQEREYIAARAKHGDWTPSPAEPLKPVRADAQQQLLNAVLADEILLDTWAKREILLHINDRGAEEAYEPSDDDVETLLMPVIRNLPRGVRSVFESAEQRGELYEEVDDFFGAFTAKVREVWISEVRT